MKKITQTIEYEGANDSKLRRDLTAWYKQQPFASGIDWEFQYFWATMTEEQCLMFLLKHPEYAGRFQTI